MTQDYDKPAVEYFSKPQDFDKPSPMFFRKQGNQWTPVDSLAPASSEQAQCGVKITTIEPEPLLHLTQVYYV